jgi:hypothetical protein
MLQVGIFFTIDGLILKKPKTTKTRWVGNILKPVKWTANEGRSTGLDHRFGQ